MKLTPPYFSSECRAERLMAGNVRKGVCLLNYAGIRCPPAHTRRSGYMLISSVRRHTRQGPQAGHGRRGTVRVPETIPNSAARHSGAPRERLVVSDS